MFSYNLNAYNSQQIIEVDYNAILDLPVKYPEFKIQRPLANDYLFYSIPNKTLYNYFKD